MTNIISGQKTGGQYLVGGLDCTVHRNFFGSHVNACAVCNDLPRRYGIHTLIFDNFNFYKKNSLNFCL